MDDRHFKVSGAMAPESLALGTVGVGWVNEILTDLQPSSDPWTQSHEVTPVSSHPGLPSKPAPQPDAKM